QDVLEGAAVAASLVFPPAVLAVPVIETIQLCENYDLIIGIDGNRVTNFMDFQDQLRDARPGETVYLNILRGGKRLQIPVEMPAPSSAKLQPSFWHGWVLLRRGENLPKAPAGLYSGPVSY